MTDDIVARLREAMKSKARELPYMSTDVEFFGVTDDEWDELLSVVIAPLRADLAAAKDALSLCVQYFAATKTCGPAAVAARETLAMLNKGDGDE